jgi:oligopeptide transport system substrate-binding protein
VTLLAVLLTVVGGCTALSPKPKPPPSTLPPRSGGEITIALAIPNPGNLDPARAERPGERILAANLFDGLTTLDREGRAQPAAAESWTADPEQRTWTFRLRQGATFADGAAVTAASFVTAWERVARSPRAAVRALLARVDGAAAYAGSRADQIKGLAAPDDATLTVTLTAPFADFPALTAEPALAPVPAKAVSDPAGFAARPIGNGPFLLAEPEGTSPEGEGQAGTAPEGTASEGTASEGASPGDAGAGAAQGVGAPVRSLVLTPNPAAGAKPYLERVRLLAVPDEQTAWLAFQEGQVAFAPVPLDQLEAARILYQPDAGAGTSGAPGGSGVAPGNSATPGNGVAAAPGGLVSSPEAVADVLGFDRTSAPFSDRGARLGVALAIDRRRLASRFSGARAPADALVPDGVRMTAGAACPACAHDPARARQLLAEAGVTAFTLTVPTGPLGRTFADQISADLKAAGVTVKVRGASAGSLNRPSGGGATVVTLVSPAGATSAGAFLAALYGGRGTALKPGQLDPAVADLLQQSVASADEPTRERSARQAQDHLEAEAIAVPLLEHRHHAAVAPGVLGLDLTPSGLIDLAAASLADPTAAGSRR